MSIQFLLEHVWETESTNDDLKRRAKDGAPEGIVLTADRQTAGRGQRGRSFYSPPECGLYASVLLRPSIPISDVNRITCYAAVVLYRAIRQMTDGEIGIKWVNDIYRNGRKVCGILTEAASHADGTTAYVVVGLGVNMCMPPGGFPPNIADIAGSVFDSDVGAVDAKVDLLRCVLDGLKQYPQALSDMQFMDEYCAASVLKNTPVRISRGDDIREATAVCVEPSGKLLVRYTDGTTERLLAGDVSIQL